MIVLLFFICTSYASETSESTKNYSKSPDTNRSIQSNSNESVISECRYYHGDIIIKVRQSKNLKNEFKVSDNPLWCSASIEIIKNNDLLKKLSYENILPVGYYYGVFVPKVQPISKYFILVKHGDYNGRLLLINKQGKVTDLPGGLYFISKDNRYLFSKYTSDYSYFLIFDLQLDKVVYESNTIPNIHQWYYQDDRYFFTSSEWAPHSSLPTEGYEFIYVYNFKTNQLLKKHIDFKLESASKQFYDFDPNEYTDCNCKEKYGLGVGPR